MRNRDISTQQVLDILAINPLLEALHIDNSTLDHRLEPPQGPHPTIQLPNLRSIFFEETNGDATGAILTSIQAPNCIFLLVHCREHYMESSDNFPEPALTHFNYFLRRTISVNDHSKISFLDEGIDWECQSEDLERSGFGLSIRYAGTAGGVEWATRIIGIGDQELVHDLEMTISHDTFTDDDFAAYHSISRCRSVTKLTVEYDPPFPRPILDLLGNWEDLGDGTKPLPGFPRLERLVLVLSEASWIDDLETLVSRRFGGRDDFIGDQVPGLDIVLEMWGDYADSDFWVDMARLQRLRATNGVRSITRVMDRGVLP